MQARKALLAAAVALTTALSGAVQAAEEVVVYSSRIDELMPTPKKPV